MKILNLGFKNNILLCLALSLLQVLIIHISGSIYLPIMATVSFSFFYGIIEPKKGWILSLIQIATLIMLYWILKMFGIKAVDHDTAMFATHISFVPSLISALFSSLIVRM